MALINSIVVGKGRGKVGNTVLTVLKGQNIIKSYNDAPAVSQNAVSIASRAAMSNCVMAYQFLATFLAMATGWKKSTESIYNSFVRITKSSFSTTLATSRALAVAALPDGVYGVSGTCSVVSIANTSTAGTLTINSGGLPFPIAVNAYILKMNSITGVNTLQTVVVTSTTWGTGVVPFVAVAAANEFILAYVQVPSNGKTSQLIKKVATV